VCGSLSGLEGRQRGCKVVKDPVKENMPVLRLLRLRGVGGWECSLSVLVCEVCSCA